MDPQTVIQCSASCTVTVVHELSLPPLQLSVDDGAQISFAIVGVWVIGWAVRQLVRLIRETGPVEKVED